MRLSLLVASVAVVAALALLVVPLLQVQAKVVTNPVMTGVADPDVSEPSGACVVAREAGGRRQAQKRQVCGSARMLTARFVFPRP
jgi:hypothetical protein